MCGLSSLGLPYTASNGLCFPPRPTRLRGWAEGGGLKPLAPTLPKSLPDRRKLPGRLGRLTDLGLSQALGGSRRLSKALGGSRRLGDFVRVRTYWTRSVPSHLSLQLEEPAFGDSYTRIQQSHTHTHCLSFACKWRRSSRRAASASVATWGSKASASLSPPPQARGRARRRRNVLRPLQCYSAIQCYSVTVLQRYSGCAVQGAKDASEGKEADPDAFVSQPSGPSRLASDFGRHERPRVGRSWQKRV